LRFNVALARRSAAGGGWRRQAAAFAARAQSGKRVSSDLGRALAAFEVVQEPNTILFEAAKRQVRRHAQRFRHVSKQTKHTRAHTSISLYLGTVPSGNSGVGRAEALGVCDNATLYGRVGLCQARMLVGLRGTSQKRARCGDKSVALTVLAHRHKLLLAPLFKPNPFDPKLQ